MKKEADLTPSGLGLHIRSAHYRPLEEDGSNRKAFQTLNHYKDDKEVLPVSYTFSIGFPIGNTGHLPREMA